MNILMYIIFLLYLVALVWIGRKSHSSLGESEGDYLNDFLVAGREIGVLGLAFSFAATAASAGTFVGCTGLGYNYGFAGVMMNLSNIATVYLPLGIIAKRVNVVARRVDAVTMPDLLESRFESSYVSLISSIVIVVFYLAYMVSQFMAGGRVFQAFFNIPYAVALLIFAGITFFYVSYGGFRAVVATDVLQGIIMMVAIPIVLIAVYKNGGGFASLINALGKEDPSLLCGPGPNNFLPFTMLLSYWIAWPVMSIGQPAQCNHFMSFKDSKTLNKALIVGAITSIFYYVIGFIFISPLIRPLIPNISIPDLVIPTFVVNTLHPVLAGLIIAAPFAAIMSTTDTMLLTTTGTIAKNIYKRFIRPNASEDEMRRVTTVLPWLLGILIIAFALNPVSLLEFIVIFAWGGLGSAFLPALFLGLYWKRATTEGAIASMISGAAANIIIYLVNNNPMGFATSAWSLLISTGSMIVVSLLTEPNSNEALEVFFD